MLKRRVGRKIRGEDIRGVQCYQRNDRELFSVRTTTDPGQEHDNGDGLSMKRGSIGVWTEKWRKFQKEVLAENPFRKGFTN